jgi:alkylhydroperoxidase family enzyme
MSNSWLPTAGPDPLELRPELATLYRTFEGRLWRDRLVDPELLELCRLRIASLLGDEAGAASRTPGVEIGEGRDERLADWPADPAFDDLHRAGLAFAEQFVIDSHGVSDDQFAAVAEHLTPDEMVAFTTALGLFDGMSRFRLVLGVAPR